MSKGRGRGRRLIKAELWGVGTMGTSKSGGGVRSRCKGSRWVGAGVASRAGVVAGAVPYKAPLSCSSPPAIPARLAWGAQGL